MHPSIHPTVCLSICTNPLFVLLYICVSKHFAIHLSLCLTESLFERPADFNKQSFPSLSICLYLYLPLHPSFVRQACLAICLCLFVGRFRSEPILWFNHHEFGTSICHVYVAVILKRSDAGEREKERKKEKHRRCNKENIRT